MVQCAEWIWIHKQVALLNFISRPYWKLPPPQFSFSNLKNVFTRNDTKEDVFVHQVRQMAFY